MDLRVLRHGAESQRRARVGEAHARRRTGRGRDLAPHLGSQQNRVAGSRRCWRCPCRRCRRRCRGPASQSAWESRRAASRPCRSRSASSRSGPGRGTWSAPHRTVRRALARTRCRRDTARRRRCLSTFASRTAGAMMSISSRPKLPLSPACGLSAATAMRGGEKPAAAMAACVSSSPLTIAGMVSSPGTAARGTWLVTRAFHKPSSTLNSRASPLKRMALAVNEISSS